jgi:hypothetical protein
MKSVLYICLLLIGSLAWMSMDNPGPHARPGSAMVDTSKRKATAKAGTAATGEVPKYIPFAGCTQGSATLSKQAIIDALKKSLCVKNINNQKQYTVVSYDFIYAERGLFEDSSGIPTVITEYHYEECRGDSIKARWQRVLAERLYKGDTVKVTQVVFNVDGKNIKIKDNLVLVAQ